MYLGPWESRILSLACRGLLFISSIFLPCFGGAPLLLLVLRTCLCTCLLLVIFGLLLHALSNLLQVPVSALWKSWLCLGPGGPHTAPTNLTEVNSSLHPLQHKVWNVSHWFEVSVLLLRHSARSQNSRAGRDFEVWGHGYKWSLQLWYKIGNVSKRDQDQVFSVFISSWKGPWGFLLPTGYCGTHFEDHLSRQALLFHGWKNLVSETRRRAVILAEAPRFYLKLSLATRLCCTPCIHIVGAQTWCVNECSARNN